jgi:chemotaxis protein MotB
MVNKVIKKVISREEEIDYWISYSDLMAGILIVFILLFIFKMVDYQDAITDYKEGIRKQEEMIYELDETRKELAMTKEKVIELSSTRLKIIALLQDEFDKENIKIIIDPDTGAIKLKEGILFDTGKSIIKEDGKEFLEQFIPVYLRILLGNPEIREEIAEIIVEGHTDDVGTYIYNLNLSQERAFNVVRYLLGDDFEYRYKEELKGYITANGKSFSKLIYNDANEIDREGSRRVEFKFRLTEEETLMEIKKQLEEAIQ